jgi:ABC-2 type transport system ATP-binding protein
MDPRGRRELRDILHELRRFGKTILISSHLLGELAEVCTHLGIMRDGELIAEGSTDEIMAAASGEAQLRLTLLDRANRDRVRRLLQETLTVKGGSYLAGRQIDDDGESSLLIRPGGTGTEVAELVEQLCSQGVQMTEVALLQPTLEDILLQVTDVKAEA